MNIIIERDKKTGIRMTVIGVAFVVFSFVMEKILPDIDKTDIIITLICGGALMLYGVCCLIQPKQAIVIKDGVIYVRRIFSTRVIGVKSIQGVSCSERRFRLNTSYWYRQKHDINALNITFSEKGLLKQIRVFGIKNCTEVLKAVNLLIKKEKQGNSL